MTDTAPPLPPETDARRRWMGVLARASVAELGEGLGAIGPLPGYRFLRAPETGLTLLRGRIGGSGEAFNLGEMTVTRCAVAFEDGGEPGVAYVAGRDPRQAELAAVLDALLLRQSAPAAALVERLAEAQAERRRRTQATVAPSKVEFFTLVRE